MYKYEGKQRRDSRHWWRRIQSRKYRRVLIVKSVLIVMVTAVMFLLASLSSVGNGLCLLAWCLVVGIILIPFQKNLRGTQSKESPQAQQTSRRVSKPQEVGTTSQRTIKASTYRIDEILSKNINTESQETSQI
ncbi:MAG: hypothetical protein GY774_14485 [Planctomycetes bacterium]|nr:hypothetical protein [Planctomycetota bacterium]